MEALANSILRGSINLYSLDRAELHRLADRLGRIPLPNSTAKSYLLDRVLSEIFSYAHDGKDYALSPPPNVRLANLITYYPNSNQQHLLERVMNGELNPLCCLLTIAQLEAISSLLDIPLPGVAMTESDLISALTTNIRRATLNGTFDISDEELQLPPYVYEDMYEDLEPQMDDVRFGEDYDRDQEFLYGYFDEMPPYQ